MSVRNDVPPGFRSVQDYILHLSGIDFNRPNNTSAIFEKPVLEDSGDDFKKENCLKVQHKLTPENTLNQNNKRCFYERPQNSSVHPDSLMNPKDINFQPI